MDDDDDCEQVHEEPAPQQSWQREADDAGQSATGPI